MSLFDLTKGHVDDRFSKYRYMELSLANRRKALSSKIPDIESTLNVVNYLQARREKVTGAKGGDVEDLSLEDDDESEEKPLKTLFELNDTLYAEAELDETGEVGIWLGVGYSMRLWVVQRRADDSRRKQCCCTLSRKLSSFSLPSSRARTNR